MAQMAEIFNNNSEFDTYALLDDTHTTTLPDILGVLDPSASPAPGPLTGDQLLQVINWTRRTATLLTNKYDRSGHLEHGSARLEEIYNHFCQGPRCPEPIDHPKAACFLFAAFGLGFQQVSFFRFYVINFHISIIFRAIIQLGGIACCPDIQDVFSVLRMMKVMQSSYKNVDSDATTELTARMLVL
jgi:hypothetical protein